MGQALYRTYRSKKLSEIVGQEHITSALGRALAKGIISHAYLFTGPRGTGKTSIARILAHEINGLPYTEDRPHLDIIEIDAASNRRIDEIRDLRDKVHTAPTSAKYKVYIIDEVHMLTKEAFNALLKTLEEPPAHAIFILATTEVHKLPETIISRTQRFAFKPVDLDKVAGHLRSIADAEKIKIDDDALLLIAAHGEGSFRDSISLLDQARHASDKVTLVDVQKILGIAPQTLIDDLLAAVNENNPVKAMGILMQMREQGYEAAQIARQVGKAIRATIVSGKMSLPHDVGIKLLEKLVQVPASPSPLISLEVALLDAMTFVQAPAQTPKNEGQKKVAKERVSEPPVQVDYRPSTFQKRVAEEESPSSPQSDFVLDDALWQEVLAQLKQQHSTLHTAAKFAQPQFEAGIVRLVFGYSFHQKRLNDKRNRETVISTIKSVTGQEVILQCVVDEDAKLAQANAPLPPRSDEIAHTVAPAPAPTSEPQPVIPVSKAAPAQSEAVSTISNIFGGAEVLET